MQTTKTIFLRHFSVGIVWKVALAVCGLVGCSSTTSPASADSGTPVADAAPSAEADGGGKTDAPAILHDGGSADTGGCITSAQCGPREYCNNGGRCGSEGFCEGRPEVCTGEHAPVCACDGNTYSNACAAASNGAAATACPVLAEAGVQTAKLVPGTCGSAQCTADKPICAHASGGPAPGFSSYQCLPVPSVCSLETTCECVSPALSVGGVDISNCVVKDGSMTLDMGMP